MRVCLEVAGFAALFLPTCCSASFLSAPLHTPNRCGHVSWISVCADCKSLQKSLQEWVLDSIEIFSWIPSNLSWFCHWHHPVGICDLHRVWEEALETLGLAVTLWGCSFLISASHFASSRKVRGASEEISMHSALGIEAKHNSCGMEGEGIGDGKQRNTNM